LEKLRSHSRHNLIGIFLFFTLFCFSQNKNSEQNRVIDSIIKKLPSLSGKEKVTALDDLCYYTSTSDIDQSILYGNRAAALALELGDTLLIATCKNDVALSYFFKGNFDSCIFLAEQAYKIRLAKNKWRDAGASMSKVALGYYEKGKYGISLEKNLIALELFKKGNSIMEAAKLQNNIGSIYERNNQLEEAKKNYLESASAALQLKDYEGYVTAKGNYAIAIRKQGKGVESIQIYNELIPICEKYCKEEYLSQIYQSLGVAERKMGHIEKGLNYYLKAKTVYDRIGSLNGSSVININIGNAYADLKKFKEAEEFLNLGLKQSEEIKSLAWQKLAYFGLYDMERLRQNFEKANFYLEKYQAFSDSIYNEETQNKLGELQTQYNVQQKENTILVQKNTIAENELSINKQNTFLIILISAFAVLLLLVLFIIQRNNIIRKKSELAFQKKIQKERSRISKDLHDNMGAELTIISSSIDIKAHGIEKEKDKLDLENISDQVRKASALMRDTIWTVSEEKISMVQFGIKIKEFADRTFKHKNITVHFKNANNELNLRPESTLNLFRIVQEVINNASKHSDAKNFYIENFSNNDHEITLQDDGSGFDMNAVERGYGLNNITQRALDINGKLDFEIKKGEYTRVKIVISDDSIWRS
jgi:signal transduction histidine kinase